MDNLDIIILAADKGTKMHSNRPKLLHELGGQALLKHLLKTVEPVRIGSGATSQLHIIYQHQELPAQFSDIDCQWVQQQPQEEPGHAILQALSQLQDEGMALIVQGDLPLLQTETLNRLMALSAADTIALLAAPARRNNDLMMGERQEQASSIITYPNTDESQGAIKELSSSIMLLSVRLLKHYLPALNKDNPQGDYQLADIITATQRDNIMVQWAPTTYAWELQRVSNRAQLAAAEKHYQRHQAQQLMEQGLGLIDPDRFDLRGQLTFGQDCLIDVNVVITGTVTLGKGVHIGPHCCIDNSVIGKAATISSHSVINQAVVGQGAQVGPYARLRPGTRLAAGSKVGNFVETKNMELGEGSKANHLAYIGDAKVGPHANIGAGVITCNYDGANKHTTIIEAGAFIGSNSALVAPVTIGANATIGAGSVITKKVPPKALGLTRPEQTHISGWNRPTKGSQNK